MAVSLYDSKRPVRFRLHIDHIDNPDKDVWAIRVFPPEHIKGQKSRYYTARRVWVFTQTQTHYQPCRQPRAYLRGFGRVQQLDEWTWRITDA